MWKNWEAMRHLGTDGLMPADFRSRELRSPVRIPLAPAGASPSGLGHPLDRRVLYLAKRPVGRRHLPRLRPTADGEAARG